MKTAPKSRTTRSCFKWSIVSADLQEGGREGRSHEGRNGQEHLVGHRSADPGIERKTGRDNVGKGHLPAGTGNNLQRLSPIRWIPKWAERDLVWRMSPYERRRRGNALRGRARLAHDGGNSNVVQRGSGHLAVPEARPGSVPGPVHSRSRDEPMSKPRARGVYACQRLSLIARGKARGGKPRSEPDSGKPTVRDRRGAWGNVAYGGPRIPPSIPKGLVMETIHLRVRAPQLYPDHRDTKLKATRCLSHVDTEGPEVLRCGYVFRQYRYLLECLH